MSFNLTNCKWSRFRWPGILW